MIEILGGLLLFALCICLLVALTAWWCIKSGLDAGDEWF